MWAGAILKWMLFSFPTPVLMLHLNMNKIPQAVSAQHPAG